MRFPTNTLAIANLYALLSAINASVAPIVIALGGLTGAYLLSDDKSLATLPVSGFNVGVALMAGPASLLMFRIGRQKGFMAGAMLGVVGVSIAGIAILQHSFLWFCVGLALTGGANSFVQQYRFAASDFVDDALKAQAISRVLIGGIAAAIVGPQIVLHNKDLLYPIPFAGAFLSGAGLFCIGLLIMTLLPNERSEKRTPVDVEGRTKQEFLRDPTFLTAVLCGTSSYALMAFVMTAAPLAMVGCGFEVSDAAIGIQWHVLAMFVPSLFTGKLIRRFGKLPIIATGLVTLMACSAVALSGISIEHFYLALILLGLGWNFGFIGSTALLTETYQAHEKHTAQGLNDTILFGFVAFGSLSSGVAYEMVGWETMNWIAYPIGLVCLVALFLERQRHQSEVVH
ncbi:MAG: MFS transporter [Litorivicinaceae bacterium]|jgi:MFS family permease